MRKFVFGASKRPLTEARTQIYGSVFDLTNGGADDLTNADLITDMPEAVEDFDVLLSSARTNTSSQPPIIRIGPSGGVATAGYSSNVSIITGSSAAETDFTDGVHPFRDANYANTEDVTGVVRFTRWDPNQNLWMAESIVKNAVEQSSHATFITLGGPLAIVAVTTPGGTAFFTNGDARVRYRVVQ